jgi:hypothetical protein
MPDVAQVNLAKHLEVNDGFSFALGRGPTGTQ